MSLSLSHLSLPELIARFNEGWNADNLDAPREIVARMCLKIGGRCFGEEPPSRSLFTASFCLDGARYLFSTNVGLQLLSRGADVQRALASERELHGNRLRVTIAAPEQFELAHAMPRMKRHILLTITEFQALVSHPRPLDRLKQLIRAHVDRRLLIPYDSQHPVASNMFFGRQDLLDRLKDEETTSFAIAGPGRIGKSSLLNQYRYQLRCDLYDERRLRLHFVDFQPYGNLDPDALAQRLALDIDGGSMAGKTKQHTLVRFFEHQSRSGREPLELLLDEVDTVCTNPAFEKLGEAIRMGYCRAILCGKGGLYRVMRTRDTQFSHRLELVQPSPLDMEAAERLVVEPLQDLGFSLPDLSSLRDRIFEMSGRRPHLIQASCKRLVEFELRRGGTAITCRTFEEIKDDLISSFFGSVPLNDLRDDLTRLMALLLLRDGGFNHLDPARSRIYSLADISHSSTNPHRVRSVTVGYLQELAAKQHITLTGEQALGVCEDLWICNVLNREHTEYYLANPHLSHFVRKMDFNSEISRLTRLAQQSQSSVAGGLKFFVS